jgi:ubiquitin-protein ligase
MKSIKEKIIQNQLKECELINKENKNISIYVKTIQDKKEYYLNITISKRIFTSEEILMNNLVPLDIYFILHLTPNFPLNPPRLFCLTSLSSINVNICDAKDILNLVIEKDNWNNKITAKEIILKIPDFLNNFSEKNKGMFFIGKYDLDLVYDYKILCKIPNTYFSEIEQILNDKNYYSEKRLLMITDLFFLIFSFDYGMISSYSNIRLIFWASIKSIFGMKNTEKMFQFEFSKTENQRIYLFFNTIEGAKIMDIVLENLRKCGIDYSINKAKPGNLIEENKDKNNELKKEAKLLPKLEVLDNNFQSNINESQK